MYIYHEELVALAAATYFSLFEQFVMHFCATSLGVPC